MALPSHDDQICPHVGGGAQQRRDRVALSQLAPELDPGAPSSLGPTVVELVAKGCSSIGPVLPRFGSPFEQAHRMDGDDLGAGELRDVSSR